MTRKARLVQGAAGKRSRGSGVAMVRYIDAGGDEHYVGLAEAAAVPFENGRMARNIPAYRDIAHTPGRYWAATTGELVEFESHLEEKWLTLLDFDAGVAGFSSQPMELEAADEHGPWHHVPNVFARRADGSALLLDVKNPARLDDEQVRLQASRTAALCDQLGWDYQMAGEPPAQPGFCLITARQEAIDSGIVNLPWPHGTPAIIHGPTLAYRAKPRRAAGTDARYEFGAVGHGPGAAGAARLLAERIRAWDVAGRPRPRLTVLPAGTPDARLPAGYVLDKRHTRLVISWQPARSNRKTWG